MEPGAVPGALASDGSSSKLGIVKIWFLVALVVQTVLPVFQLKLSRFGLNTRWFGTMWAGFENTIQIFCVSAPHSSPLPACPCLQVVFHFSQYWYKLIQIDTTSLPFSSKSTKLQTFPLLRFLWEHKTDKFKQIFSRIWRHRAHQLPYCVGITDYKF